MRISAPQLPSAVAPAFAPTTSLAIAPMPAVRGPKLPPVGSDRDLAVQLLARLAQSGQTGRRELDFLNQAGTTIRFREGSGAEYGGTIERGDNTITIGRNAQNDLDYAAEIMAHEIGHQIWSMLHLDDRVRAAGANPRNGAGRLINEAFSSAFGNQVRRDFGRTPDTGHGSNLREDYLTHLDPNARLGKFYLKAYDIDITDPETIGIRDVTSVPALRSLLPLLRDIGVRDEYLTPGLT